MSNKIQLGIGSISVNPISAYGNPPSPAFPQKLLDISEGEISYKGKIEKLMGQFKLASAAGSSDEDITFKISVGRVSLDIYNLAWGETITTGTKLPIENEGPTAIPTTPFTITVAQGATFFKDRGVTNAGTGQPMQRVVSGPTAGQYSVNEATGVYTFASADNVSGISVLISYLYTPASGGRTLTKTNRVQGYTVFNEIIFVGGFTCPAAQTPLGVIRLRAAIVNEVGSPFKRNGFLMTPLNGEAFPDPTGAALDMWSPD